MKIYLICAEYHSKGKDVPIAATLSKEIAEKNSLGYSIKEYNLEEGKLIKFPLWGI